MQLYIQNMKGCKDFFELYSHCRTANDIFTVFFVKRTILCLEFGNLY